MNTVRIVEVFSAGCQICESAIEMVRNMSCPSCKIKIMNMKDKRAEKRAAELGIRTIPAIAVNGRLVSCCDTRGPNVLVLKASGIGCQLR